MREQSKSEEDGLVAQLVEQRIENPRVGGSIPPQATRTAKPLILNGFKGFCILGVALTPRFGTPTWYAEAVVEPIVKRLLRESGLPIPAKQTPAWTWLVRVRCACPSTVVVGACPARRRPRVARRWRTASRPTLGRSAASDFEQAVREAGPHARGTVRCLRGGKALHRQVPFDRGHVRRVRVCDR
jgi:hypothetical protein